MALKKIDCVRSPKVRGPLGGRSEGCSELVGTEKPGKMVWKNLAKPGKMAKNGIIAKMPGKTAQKR